METPLRERSGGHAGAAPTVSLEQIARGCTLPSVLGHLFMCISSNVRRAQLNGIYYWAGYEWSLISSRKMGNEMWYLMAKKRMQQMAKKVAMEVSPTLTSSLKSSQ